MSFRCSTDSLHSSGSDSDGPCVVLSPRDPLARGARSPLSRSLDEIVSGVSHLMQPPSKAHSSAPLPTIIALPPAAQPLSTLLLTKPDCEQLFKSINLLAPAPRFAERLLRCTEGAKGENVSKNRYPDMTPTDHNLVKIACRDRYINASHFKGLIITQGPLEETLEDFWMMLFEQKVAHLISLTNQWEQKGLERIEKTSPFWVPVKDELLFESKIDDKLLTVKRTQAPKKIIPSLQGDNQCVEKQVFAINFDGQTVITQHRHFLNWMDHSVCDPKILVQLIENLLVERALGTCAVHCSAGIGRSGTFAVLYLAVLQYLETKKAPIEGDICTMIIQLRQSRFCSVAYANQLQLIFDTLELFIQRSLTKPK